MFITKKRFNEEIDKAIREAREKEQVYDQMDRIDRNAHDRIEREARWLHTRIDDLTRRVAYLEKMHEIKQPNPNDISDGPNPIGY